jgi:hypothetical protein
MSENPKQVTLDDLKSICGYEETVSSEEPGIVHKSGPANAESATAKSVIKLIESYY